MAKYVLRVHDVMRTKKQISRTAAKIPPSVETKRHPNPLIHVVRARKSVSGHISGDIIVYPAIRSGER